MYLSITFWIAALAAAVRLVDAVVASRRKLRRRRQTVPADQSDEDGEPTRTLDVMFTAQFPASQWSRARSRAGCWLIGVGVKSIHRVAGQLVIGRGAGCNLRIRDPHASRRHCELIEQEGACTIVDLGSRNGVYVNDVRVLRHVLADDDVISIGRSWFRFKISCSTISNPRERAGVGS